MEMYKVLFRSTLPLHILLLAGVVHSNQRDGHNINECEPVKAKVFIDGTLGNKNETRQQFHLIFLTYLGTLPANSEADINILTVPTIVKVDTVLLRDDVEELATQLLKKLDAALLGDLQEQSQSHRQGQSQGHASSTRRPISSDAVDQDLLNYFPFGKYKAQAELVDFFVTDSLILDKVPKLLLKKKTKVVCFGQSQSQQWTAVASREDHLIRVNKTLNLSHVNKILNNLTCTDSRMYCDTDRFSSRKGSSCRKCSEYACIRMDSLTCQVRCPYYRKPGSSTTKVVNPNSTNNQSGTADGTKDHTSDIAEGILLVTGALIVVPVIAIGVVALGFKPPTFQHHNRSEQVAQPRSGRGENENTLRKDLTEIPESVPQQETAGAGGGPTDEEVAASLLKNAEEREMNVLVTATPVFLDIQAGRVGESRV